MKCPHCYIVRKWNLRQLPQNIQIKVGAKMKCPKCDIEMEPTPTTKEYPNCNTWTCSKCGHIEPELGSLVEPYDT